MIIALVVGITTVTVFNIVFVIGISAMKRQQDFLTESILQSNINSNTVLDLWIEHKKEHLSQQ